MIENFRNIALGGLLVLSTGCASSQPRTYSSFVSDDFNNDGQKEAFQIGYSMSWDCTFSKLGCLESKTWVVKSRPRNNCIEAVFGIYESKREILGLEVGEFNKDNNLDIKIYLEKECRKPDTHIMYGNGNGKFEDRP